MQVVIANDLRNGRVVFLDGSGGWCAYIDDARIAQNDEEATEMQSLAQKADEANLVIDPQLIEVMEQNGTLRPVKMREAIRAKGPTVRTDLGKQAER